ncbi:MAG: AAA family ATPase, partial [Bacteroidia bacterium]
MKEKFLEELNKYFGHSATKGQQMLMQQLASFMLSEIQDELFVIKGYAGTGKTSLVSAMIKSLSTVKFQSVLLAPTGRAAKVLTQYSGKNAYTIHKKIYKPVTNS